MLTFFRLFCFLLLFSPLCSAQNTEMESFRRIWHDASGPEKLVLIDEYFARIPIAERSTYLKEAITIARDRQIEREEARLYVRLGVNWYALGDYPKALKNYLRGLSLQEKIDDKSGMGRTYLEMATLVKKQKDFAKAQKFLDRSMDLCTSAKDSVCLGTTYNTRGLVYAEQEKWDLAEENYQKARIFYEAIKDTLGLGYLFANLAEIASAKNQYSKAIQLLKQSTTYKILSKDNFGVAINITNTGELYFKQNKLDKAAEFFQKSNAATDHADLRQWNYRFASKCFAALGKTDQALEYLTLSYALKDSLLSAKRIADLAEMETKYETEKKEQKIAVQQLELKNQKEKFHGQILLLGGGAVLLLSLALLGFLFYRQQQKTLLQQKQVTFQKQLLHSSLAVQEEERKRIAKDLHDGIGQQLVGLKMAWQNLSERIQKRNPEEGRQFLKLQKILENAAGDVRSISHQMMPRALAELGLLPAVKDLIENTFSSSKIICKLDCHALEKRLPENVEIHLYRIIQELFNNILKHAEATEADLQLHQRKNHLLVIVEDNGKGFDTESLNQKGHGMMNITSRIKSLNGQIDIESKKGEGVVVVMKIPI